MRYTSCSICSRFSIDGNFVLRWLTAAAPSARSARNPAAAPDGCRGRARTAPGGATPSAGRGARAAGWPAGHPIGGLPQRLQRLVPGSAPEQPRFVGAPIACWPPASAVPARACARPAPAAVCEVGSCTPGRPWAVRPPAAPCTSTLAAAARVRSSAWPCASSQWPARAARVHLAAAGRGGRRSPAAAPAPVAHAGPAAGSPRHERRCRCASGGQPT